MWDWSGMDTIIWGQATSGCRWINIVWIVSVFGNMTTAIGATTQL
jgi:hypothetical protein